jgi:hypothetical protein
MDGIHLDEQLCRQCRGRCCQGHSGLWSDPQRFFRIFSAGRIPSKEQFLRLLDRFGLCLRVLGGVLVPAPQSGPDGCLFRRETGCSFSIAERPCQCLALIPHLETLLDEQIHCRLPPEFGSGSARENWRPLQPLLKQLQSS